jgi:solute carrier family 25 protein 39/40
MITALAVTPLEVVKVRQQFAAAASSTSTNGGSNGQPVPNNVTRCPRGCGTFILNTGLGEYLTPKNKCGYFDTATGALKQSTEITNSRGTLRMLRSIFKNEGLPGIYSGLGPTLVMGTYDIDCCYVSTFFQADNYTTIIRVLRMPEKNCLNSFLCVAFGKGVPNTIIYFYSYEELASKLRQHYPTEPTVPAIAGAAARFVASLSTAPLELLRTQQAARVGGGIHNIDQNVGIISEFRAMILSDGVSSLFRGVYPTLMRDVPFSAVYWVGIESMRSFWKSRSWEQHGRSIDESSSSSSSSPPPISAWEQAGQALINGSVSGIIAAALTTPLDVIKTRIQVGTLSSTGSSAVATPAIQPAAAEPVCDHGGALVYRHGTPASSSAVTSGTAASVLSSSSSQSTVQIARTIVKEEGLSGLWRGNTARMMKVAPACAIMISSYDVGKRLLIE